MAAQSSTPSPRNILVTGGAGFIGSHMVIHLVLSHPEYRVINVDKLDYCSSLRNLVSLQDAPNYKFVHGNICSPLFMSYLLKEENIDTIFHFAASTHVDNSFGNSLQFSENNVLGTHVLLEAAKAYGKIIRFIHVSTDEVYGETSRGTSSDSCPSAIAGQTILQPTNPYAATKAGAEFLAMAYHKAFKLPVIITRSNNVYGPHQFPEKVIPKFTLLLMRGLPCPIHGSGEEKRNHIFVDDVIKAYDLILHQGQIGHIYNIGTPFEISNIQVAKDLIELFGLKDREDEFVTHVENRYFNDYRYTLNCDSLKLLGWAPTVPWKEGLKRTVEWYKQHDNHWDSIEGALVPHPRLGTTSFCLDK